MKHSNQLKTIIALAVCAGAMTACRQDAEEVTGDPMPPSYSGLYVLNQGNQGENKSSIDFYSIDSGKYYSSVYTAANPTAETGSLGDVGNDLQIYGSRLYAVINGSGKVEVMNARTAKRIGQIDIPNCRYIAFSGGYAYVTSFAPYGEGSTDGYVAKIDTATLQIADRCRVGAQPEGIAVSNGNLYVANTNGYAFPDYDSTLSVISLATFTETGRIAVGLNPSRVITDGSGIVWVSTSGNYADVPPRLYWIDPQSNTARRTDVPVSIFCIAGSRLYYSATEYDANYNTTISYGIVNTLTKAKEEGSFISAEAAAQITEPYGIAVNPATQDVYIGDAKNYTVQGELFCIDRDGAFKWKYTAGMLPSAMALLGD